MLAVYSNEGPGAQSLLVQSTLAEAFAYRTSWYDGIVTIASDRPIEVTPERIDVRMERTDLLYSQMRSLDRGLRAEGRDGVYALWDGSLANDNVVDMVILDDWPLVEHPEVAEALVPQAVAP